MKNSFLFVWSAGRLAAWFISSACFALFAVNIFFVLTSCSSQKELADPPIITSASHQHTLYNGGSQAIEAKAAKEDAPVAVIYYATEADCEADRNGTAEPPTEAGVYYARIRRPAGNGYKQGRDVKVEYHIQKPLPPAEHPAKLPAEHPAKLPAEHPAQLPEAAR